MTPLTALGLDALAAERLEDADALFVAGRYEGARYVCGYAIEFKLKARICRAHGWVAYPPRSDLAQLLKTHNLDTLLLLSTVNATISPMNPDDWAAVVGWNPEERYRMKTITAQEAQTMIRAAHALMAVL